MAASVRRICLSASVVIPTMIVQGTHRGSVGIGPLVVYVGWTARACPGHRGAEVCDVSAKAAIVRRISVAAAALVLWGLGSVAAAGQVRNPPPGTDLAAVARAPKPVSPGQLFARMLFFAYQRGAGPSKGHKCPMSPSCSEYARLAVERFGVLRGSILAADRLHRCGHDLRFYPTVFDDRGAGSWDPPPPAP